MEVDHDAVDPPYVQVAGVLRDRIQSGKLLPGGRVPSITELMQDFGIARNTARRAIKELADEGLVEVRQGRGTFVARPKLGLLPMVWPWLTRTPGAIQPAPWDGQRRANRTKSTD